MQMANLMCKTPVLESKNLHEVQGAKKKKKKNQCRRCTEMDLGSRLEKGKQNPFDYMIIGPGRAESWLDFLIWHA